MKFDKIYTVCYDTLDVFNTKEEARKFYSDCYYNSEGAEHERYANILIDLNFCDIGKYNLIINNEEFKLTAWDNLESVIDNINSMLNLFKEKDKIENKEKIDENIIEM